MFKKLTDTVSLVENDGASPLLTDEQSALDLIGTAVYVHGCSKLILAKKDIVEDFFDLRTGMAGAILQKFSNYGVWIAIVGDFKGYTSKNLQDFIYESNKGRVVYFASSFDEAAAALTKGE